VIRAVLDANVYVSAAVRPEGTPGQIIDRVFRGGLFEIVVSQAIVETWILQGASLNNANRQVGLKERLQPGISIAARVWPPRNPLFLNDAQTVLPTRPDDARQSSRIVGGGHIRFSNGDVLAFGGGPTF
jgi:hypothetical protein